MRKFGIILLLMFSAAAQAALLSNGPLTINVDGETRRAAQVYLPFQYDVKAEWPLVILLHGYTGTAASEDIYLGMSARASLRGYVLLIPEGRVNSKGAQFWNATDFCCDFEHTQVNDVEYITKLIKRVQETYHIDARRIYLYGHSNGGYMVNRLACESATTFAAVASLAGGSYKNSADCKGKEPLSYLQIHAVDDPTVPYGDDPRFSGGKATVANWVARNGCAPDAVTGPRKDLVFTIPFADTTPQIWNKCANGTEVQFWTVKAYKNKHHNAHVPIFNLWGTDAVLDFLFSHSLVP